MKDINAKVGHMIQDEHVTKQIRKYRYEEQNGREETAATICLGL